MMRLWCHEKNGANLRVTPPSRHQKKLAEGKIRLPFYHGTVWNFIKWLKEMDFLKEREDYKEGESREMIFLKEWESGEKIFLEERGLGRDPLESWRVTPRKSVHDPPRKSAHISQTKMKAMFETLCSYLLVLAYDGMETFNDCLWKLWPVSSCCVNISHQSTLLPRECRKSEVPGVLATNSLHP